VACEYHSQGPVFHEGWKGWGCCPTRHLEFDEFLKIPGCTIGRHVEKAQEVKKEMAEWNSDLPDVKDVEWNKQVMTPVPPEQISNPSPAAVLASVHSQSGPKEEELDDSLDAVIQVGAKCLRRTCTATYKDATSRQEQCIVS
jgi:hypothetical protein